MSWPATRADLEAAQRLLAAAQPEPYRSEPGRDIAGCFVCFERGVGGPGAAGDRGWAAAVSLRGGKVVDHGVVSGRAGAAYERGLLALREGPLLERAARALSRQPGVLLVNATGRDHPRRAGLALHLGAVLGLPTVGVTHRTLLADGPSPGTKRGAKAPLHVSGRLVGYRLRTRSNALPVAVNAAWRTDPDRAAAIVEAATRGARTPEPIRQARRLAREARARAEPDMQAS